MNFNRKMNGIESAGFKPTRFRQRPRPERKKLNPINPNRKIETWCGREDSNFHGFYPTATSTLRVYQFRHGRDSCGARLYRIETPM